MLIRYIKTGDNPIEDNLNRIRDVKRIKDIFDFTKLSELIKGNNSEGLKKCLENEMFFEEISQGEVHNLQRVFNAAVDKEQMLRDLETEYRTRATKGFFMCWHFALNKYKDGQVKK
ncbi:MAG: hypothetical protein ACRC18_06865 [Cetobacterium sp.]